MSQHNDAMPTDETREQRWEAIRVGHRLASMDWQPIRCSCGADIDSIHDHLHELYRALADREIAELRREVERVTVERANGQVLVVNQSLLTDLAARELRALGERDRARATAVALEAELAVTTEPTP